VSLLGRRHRGELLAERSREMTVRFGSFNVENLFARPKAFNQPTWKEGEQALKDFADFNSLIAQAVYSQAGRDRMIELLLRLDVYRKDDGVVRRNRVPDPTWAWLRANRGTFDVEHTTTGIEIVASGRDAWIGWLQLATEPVDEISTRMTAKVIADVGADVLAVIEAENRPALDRFNAEMLEGRYSHVMLIDGNDPRGIDVGIMTTGEVEIVSMRSNVDDPDPGAPGEHLFSRDCAEYQCRLPGGAVVWVLLNHLKSQSGGGGPKRARQAQGVRDIVDGLVREGAGNIMVMGDLNEGPPAEGQGPPNLAPLFDPSGPLIDVYSLATFDPGPRPGTFQSCAIRERFDYVFLSPDLAARVTAGGIERCGLWGNPGNKNPPALWDVYDEIDGSSHAASDHAAVFVDIDV
jgi:endonuclease/exonuclease/phosphatase family metal-dependent hydrolase